LGIVTISHETPTSCSSKRKKKLHCLDTYLLPSNALTQKKKSMAQSNASIIDLYQPSWYPSWQSSVNYLNDGLEKPPWDFVHSEWDT
jgi:hypothetical protein